MSQIYRPEKCNSCKYRHGDKSPSCNYILHTRQSRGCSVEDCDKFEVGLPSFTPDKGCAVCKHYELSADLFNGWCKKQKRETWDYKPACEYFKEAT